MLYLLHSDFQGNPIGLWNENGENYYFEDNTLKKSAQGLMDSRFDGESWEEFADRLSDRVSHRDWWETHESSNTDLAKVWYEIVPSAEPLL